MVLIALIVMLTIGVICVINSVCVDHVMVEDVTGFVVPVYVSKTPSMGFGLVVIVINVKMDGKVIHVLYVPQTLPFYTYHPTPLSHLPPSSAIIYSVSETVTP